MRIILEAKCEGGHSQRITYEGDWVGMEYVEMFAKMLEAGPGLVGPPKQGLGKCGKCGTQIHCTITNEGGLLKALA